jgi:hypothetical protein
MVIFTDSNGQVMATYTHDTNSTVWTDAGYTRHEIEENDDINRLGRDCYVVFAVDGTVADVIGRANTVQPTD